MTQFKTIPTKYSVDLFACKEHSKLQASLLQQATSAALRKTAAEKGSQQSTLYGVWNPHLWKES